MPTKKKTARKPERFTEEEIAMAVAEAVRRVAAAIPTKKKKASKSKSNVAAKKKAASKKKAKTKASK